MSPLYRKRHRMASLQYFEVATCMHAAGIGGAYRRRTAEHSTLLVRGYPLCADTFRVNTREENTSASASVSSLVCPHHTKRLSAALFVRVQLILKDGKQKSAWWSQKCGQPRLVSLAADRPDRHTDADRAEMHASDACM